MDFKKKYVEVIETLEFQTFLAVYDYFENVLGIKTSGKGDENPKKKRKISIYEIREGEELDLDNLDWDTLDTTVDAIGVSTPEGEQMTKKRYVLPTDISKKIQLYSERLREALDVAIGLGFKNFKDMTLGWTLSFLNKSYFDPKLPI